MDFNQAIDDAVTVATAGHWLTQVIPEKRLLNGCLASLSVIAGHNETLPLVL